MAWEHRTGIVGLHSVTRHDSKAGLNKSDCPLAIHDLILVKHRPLNSKKWSKAEELEVEEEARSSIGSTSLRPRGG
ncbi:hypothetical protein CR513_15752, partial [Mucuna pruriens]